MAKARSSDANRAARLLLKAIQTLTQAEQKVVLEYLISIALVQEKAAAGGSGYLASSPGYAPGGGSLRSPAVLRAIEATIRASGAQIPGQQQVVPVRFSTDQYDRLKQWCGEHDFSMAVVIRGLVERFLDEQERRAS